MWIRVLRWMMLASLIPMASAAEQVVSDDPPSLVFLDYLGQLVEADGELVGPADFDDETDEQPDQEQVPVKRDTWMSRDAQGGFYRE